MQSPGSRAWGVGSGVNQYDECRGRTPRLLPATLSWFIASQFQVVARLRKELDAAFDHDKTSISKYESVKDLTYLQACIDEGLRLRPSLDAGFPRLIAPGGMLVGGQWLKGGTTVSVSTHTIHRDAAVFHEKLEEYVPERWLREDSSKMQRGFLAFSQEGRACIGRNIAYFEMALVIILLFSRYDLALPSPGWCQEVEEHFSTHV
ncbi:Fc.00g019150.m01.CDS01 [Cosmosporella sp. VM-42]